MKQDVLRGCFSASTSCKGSIPSLMPRIWVRNIQSEARQKLSNFWIPPLNITKKGQDVDSNELLIRAGFVRQAYSGIYHMLPLGLRVQNKIEALIDKHMAALGASKLSLSSISSQELWQRSGRLSTGSELFKFQDRKGTRYLLSPTHEEEITTLVGAFAASYRDLPVRVYQIGRKYRDERRPRGGLLRGREFTMKDLYTFDESDAAARKTYDAVRRAYTSFFDELNIDYLTAQADSGNMGGSLSHEYHLPSAKGEDNILCCTSCDFAKNEELIDVFQYERGNVDMALLEQQSLKENSELVRLSELIAVSADGSFLVKAYSKGSDEAQKGVTNRHLNPHAVKAALDGVGDLDTGIENPVDTFVAGRTSDRPGEGRSTPKPSVYYVFDNTMSELDQVVSISRDYTFLKKHNLTPATITSKKTSTNAFNLLKQETGDACPVCPRGRLTIKTAIEVGHTFHLGTRYSAKLGFKVAQASDSDSVAVEMGCHGIGVSRLIAATAAHLADERGLNWPRKIAPFQVVILPRTMETLLSEGASRLYDEITSGDNSTGLAVDAIIDDRPNTPLPWKLNDADLIGYPIIVVLGRAWSEGRVEVQCRRLQVKETVDVADVKLFVDDLLQQL